MPNGNNGNWIKVASLTAVGGLIVVIITILSYWGSVVNEKIDNKIIAHERDTEAVHQGQISEIQRDVAIISERQDQIRKDISEQKIQSQKNFEELKTLIRNQ